LCKSVSGSQIHNCSSYKSRFNFLRNIDTIVPNTLKIFLEEIIMPNKKKKRTELTKKCAAISPIPLWLSQDPNHSYHHYNYRPFSFIAQQI